MTGKLAVVVAAGVALGATACFPKNDVPLADIPKIATLEDLMHAQATYADPQFKKRSKASFTDAEFAAFADTGAKIGACATKLKDFSMGGTFDDWAAKLGEKGAALVAAAGAKDAAAARTALTDMKAACKGCHGEWR